MLKRREWCKEELETHLWYDPIENIWKAYTNIKGDYIRFKKRNWKIISERIAENGQFVDAEFEARRGAIKIGNAEKREYTEEQKNALRERMLKMQEARKNKVDDLLDIIEEDEDDDINISEEV
jgi:hypothetical protein